MTMRFAVADRKPLASMKQGDTVEFEVRAQPNPDGYYVIEKIAPLPTLSLSGAGKGGSKGGGKP